MYASFINLYVVTILGSTRAHLSFPGPAARPYPLLSPVGTDNTDPARRLESISWHLKDRGCENFELVERAITSPASVLVGECVHGLLEITGSHCNERSRALDFPDLSLTA